jgi:hypothetical protein
VPSSLKKRCFHVWFRGLARQEPFQGSPGAGSVCEATLSVSGINSANAGASKISNCTGLDGRNPETVRSEKTGAGPRASFLKGSIFEGWLMFFGINIAC